MQSRSRNKLKWKHFISSAFTKEDVEEFKRFLSDYSDRIPRLMGKRIDDIEAKLRQAGQPIGALDVMIAAHALTANLTLVTHNTRHFERIAGLKLEDLTQ